MIIRSGVAISTLLLCLPGARSEAAATAPNAEYNTGIKGKKVAIIGAGAAGSSVAYHLKKFTSEVNVPVDITIFDKSGYIGGRSTTVNVWDDPQAPVELGASIFVQVNKVLVSAVEAFNLTTTKYEEDQVKDNSPGLGIWNGKEFVFQQSDTGYWWDLAKLMWRYGWSPIKTNNLMKATVGKFLQMYEEPYFPWASLSEVAYSLGLTAVTAATGQQYLQENGISAAFANEIVQASTRVNYAQNLPLIHALETMVCMATSGAMAVVGGNWQMFDRMARGATTDIRLNTAVSAMRKHKDGSYTLIFSEKGHNGAMSKPIQREERFDSVVLAAPYQFSGIDIPELETIPSEVPYVELHVTLFASPHRLSPLAFNQSSGTSVPRVILTTLSPDEHLGNSPNGVGSAGFFSISTLREVHNQKLNRQEYLYKIFSPTKIEPSRLGKYLGLDSRGPKGELAEEDVSWIFRKVWHSYPYEYPRVTFEDIRLDEQLWYTSGIESFISTMETSALMGKNVAKLMADEFVKARDAGFGSKIEKVDSHSKQSPFHEEM